MLTSACECREIMRQDADRHFKGCPLRDNGHVPAAISLNDWCKEAYRVSENSGFHAEDTQRHRFPERCMLLVSEVTELFESARKGNITDPCDKPIPLSKGAEEAADIFIRLADFCAEFKIDLEYAVQTKHAYNQTRPKMHGGKF